MAETMFGENDSIMETEHKLAHLLPHWVEHNRAHLDTYRQWADKAHEAGLDEVAGHMEEAIKAVQQANAALERALEPLQDQ